jgi:hypothetical protein
MIDCATFLFQEYVTIREGTQNIEYMFTEGRKVIFFTFCSYLLCFNYNLLK